MNAGITTVRSESPGQEDNFIERRDELNIDLSNSYIVSATPIIKVEGGYGYGDAVVSSPEDAKDLVLDYIDSGVDIIKISVEDSLPPGQTSELLLEEYIKSIVDTVRVIEIDRVETVLAKTDPLRKVDMIGLITEK